MDKIILEGSRLSIDIASGVSNYAVNLIHYFRTHDVDYNIKSRMILPDNFYKNNIFFKENEIPRSELVIYNRLEFFREMLLGVNLEYKLFHSPYMFLPPKRKGHINLLTVHDLINLEKSFSARNYLRSLLLRIAIKRADYYICISNTTREKLKERFPSIKDDHIFVIYQGIDKSFLSPPRPSSPPLIFKPYLLYVGQRSGYKNFDSLLRFMAQSKGKMEINLVCIGGGAFSNYELERIQTLQLDKHIIHRGFASIEDLKFFYANATALVYTSLREGFGLPILEAMSMGCPVICGNFSSMKEIAAGNAILVEDFSPDSLASALVEVLKMPIEKLEQAKNYAKHFTWDITANKTLALYADLCKINA